MKIKNIRIQNFRCYQDASIDFDQSLLLITGSNDGGKSALLRAVELFLDTRAKPDQGDFRSLDADGSSAAEEILIITVVEAEEVDKRVRRRFWIEDDNILSTYEEEKQVPADDKLREAVSEFKGWKADEQREYLGTLGFDKFGSNQQDRVDQLENHVSRAETLAAWVEITSPNLPDVNRYNSEEMGDPVRDVQKFLKTAVADRVRELKQSGEQYAQIEQDIEQVGRDELKILEEVFSRYDYGEDETILDPDIEFDLLKGLSLNTLNVRQSGNIRPIHKLGSARRRKLLLALQEWRLESLQATEEATSLVLLYDEPDTHFDYEAQRKLFDILRALASQDGVQVIVASHSLNLIDSVDIASLVYLEDATNLNGVFESRVRRLGDWKEIHEIARALGLRNHIVLNACLLCTEGQTEERLIPELYEIDRGRSLPSIGVELVRGSDHGKDAAWLLCQQVLRNNRDAFLILDSDAKLPGSGNRIDKKAIDRFNECEGSKLVSTDINVVFVGEKEIEDVFDNRTLAAALRRYFENDIGELLPSEKDAEEIISEARNFSKGLCGGLQKETHGRTDTDFSKVSFCEHLIHIIRNDPERHPVPKEISDAFDMLEAYVDG